MSEYIRSTRECTVDQLHPELRQAIENYFQEKELGDVRSESLACCETASHKKDAGTTGSWLNSRPDTTIFTGMLLTSDRLIWVHHGDQTGTRLNVAGLNEIQVNIHASLFSKDTGLDIVGFIASAPYRVRGYIAMGPESATGEFCEKVKQAVIKANPPRKPFRWFGN